MGNLTEPSRPTAATTCEFRLHFSLKVLWTHGAATVSLSTALGFHACSEKKFCFTGIFGWSNAANPKPPDRVTATTDDYNLLLLLQRLQVIV